MLGSEKCLEMSSDLEMFLSNFSFADVLSISGDLLQCSTQTLQSINAPLQRRSLINVVNASEHKKIFAEDRLVLSLLISLFNRLLSVNQSIELGGDFLRFSMKKLSSSNNGSMDSVFLEVNLLECLSIFDDLSSLTNLSRSRSFVRLDEHLREIRSTDDEEFFLDRDPTFEVPPPIEFNITSGSSNKHFFDLKHLNVNLNYSIHLQMSTNDSVDRCFSIDSRFDGRSTIEPSKTFCLNETSKNFSLMIDSFPRAEFSSIVFVIRLTKNEDDQPCTYFLRVFLSGCFSLNEDQRWKSNQLKVTSLFSRRNRQIFRFVSFRLGWTFDRSSSNSLSRFSFVNQNISLCSSSTFPNSWRRKTTLKCSNGCGYLFVTQTREECWLGSPAPHYSLRNWMVFVVFLGTLRSGDSFTICSWCTKLLSHDWWRSRDSFDEQTEDENTFDIRREEILNPTTNTTSNARRYDSLDSRLNILEPLRSLNLSNQVNQSGYWFLKYSRPSNLLKWRSSRKMAFIDSLLLWPPCLGWWFLSAHREGSETMSIIFASTYIYSKLSLRTRKTSKEISNHVFPRLKG